MSEGERIVEVTIRVPQCVIVEAVEAERSYMCSCENCGVGMSWDKVGEYVPWKDVGPLLEALKAAYEKAKAEEKR